MLLLITHLKINFSHLLSCRDVGIHFFVPWSSLFLQTAGVLWGAEPRLDRKIRKSTKVKKPTIIREGSVARKSLKVRSPLPRWLLKRPWWVFVTAINMSDKCSNRERLMISSVCRSRVPPSIYNFFCTGDGKISEAQAFRQNTPSPSS